MADQLTPEQHAALSAAGFDPGPAPTSAPASNMPPAPRLGTVGSASGAKAEVNAQYAWRFAGLIHDLEQAGYPVHSLGGFAQRNVAGTDTPSYHSDALALDVNPDTNGRGTRGDIPPELARTIARRWGFGWGGDFHDNPDPMHFSLAAHEGGILNVSPSGKLTMGAQAPEGLTAEQQTAWDEANNLPEPTTPGGQTPGTRRIKDTGENGGSVDVPMTAAQEKAAQGVDVNADLGSAAHPYFLAPGRPIPQRPGAVYVDFDGKTHTVPGGILDQAKYYGGALAQGAAVDPVASAARLTGGGLGIPSAQPGFVPTGALAELNNPGINSATAQGALEGTRQQQNDYAIAHGGDPYAGAVRFGGQLIPSIGAAALTPEIRLPGAVAEGGLGILSRVGSRILTNAGRGAASTAPLVGTNDAPVPEQLGAGALAGIVLPEALRGTGRAAVAAAGLNRTTTPEIAALAKLAKEKYGIDIRAGQIEGVTDRNAAIRDSNLHYAPGSGVQASTREQQRAFTRAASRTIGLDTPNLTPEAADTARRNIGSVFEDAASRSGVSADDQLLTDLAKVGSQARELGLDQAQQRALDLQIQKITDAASRYRNGERGIIPGDIFQDWTRHDSSLTKIIDGDHGLFGSLAGDIRDALNAGVERASPPDVLPMLGQARFQWKNLMTLKPLIAKAGPEGMISPNLLRGQVMTKFPNYAFGDGGDLGDLARISHFMKEPPNSGTPARLADMFKGAQGQGVLSGVTAGVLSHDPGIGMATAALPFALGAGRVTRNAIRGWANDNPFARSVLVYGPGQFGDALRNFGNAADRTAAPLSAEAVHALAFPAPSPEQLALPPPQNPGVGAYIPAGQ